MRSALVVLAIAGCYRDKPVAEPPPANKVETPRPVADDVLAYLPVDAELVMGVEMGVLRGGQLYRTFEKQALDALGTKLQKMQMCGIDPTTTLSRVTVAGTLTGGDDDFQGVVVFKGVDTARALPCIASQGATNGTVQRDGDIIVVARSGNDDFAAAAVDAGTLVLKIGAEMNRASMTQTLSMGAPLRTSPAFMKLFNRREPHVAVWGMVNGNARFMQPVIAAGVKPKSVDGTVRATDELTIAMRVTLGAAADADDLVQKMGQVQGVAKPMLSRFDVRAEGAVVHMDVAATEAQLRALAGMLGGGFGP
jgi:hypothetical protein